MRSQIITIILLFLTLSCQEINDKSIIKGESVSFTKYLSLEDSSSHKIKKTFDSILKIPTLEKGVDSLEFRLWVVDQLSLGSNLFILKYQNNNWVGENIFFIEGHDSEGKERHIFNKKKGIKIDGNAYIKRHFISLEKTFPLIQILEKYNLLNFPTQRSLDEYKGGCCLDGVVYYYEIATKNSYRFCVYNNPQCCQQVKENKVIVEFINELQSSLPKNEYCWPNCSTKT